jgi:hypothetical protein
MHPVLRSEIPDALEYQSPHDESGSRDQQQYGAAGLDKIPDLFPDFEQRVHGTLP